ncbi:hypothetical protein FRB96_003603 [Tulasnella sp. 330]|nr:hypothetical protein FRB96_003603 [Tulasnella sp. 330]
MHSTRSWVSKLVNPNPNPNPNPNLSSASSTSSSSQTRRDSTGRRRESNNYPSPKPTPLYAIPQPPSSDSPLQGLHVDIGRDRYEYRVSHVRDPYSGKTRPQMHIRMPSMGDSVQDVLRKMSPTSPTMVRGGSGSGRQYAPPPSSSTSASSASSPQRHHHPLTHAPSMPDLPEERGKDGDGGGNGGDNRPGHSNRPSFASTSSIRSKGSIGGSSTNTARSPPSTTGTYTTLRSRSPITPPSHSPIDDRYATDGYGDEHEDETTPIPHGARPPVSRNGSKMRRMSFELPPVPQRTAPSPPRSTTTTTTGGFMSTRSPRPEFMASLRDPSRRENSITRQSVIYPPKIVTDDVAIRNANANAKEVESPINLSAIGDFLDDMEAEIRPAEKTEREKAHGGVRKQESSTSLRQNAASKKREEESRLKDLELEWEREERQRQRSIEKERMRKEQQRERERLEEVAVEKQFQRERQERERLRKEREVERERERERERELERQEAAERERRRKEREAIAQAERERDRKEREEFERERQLAKEKQAARERDRELQLFREREAELQREKEKAKRQQRPPMKTSTSAQSAPSAWDRSYVTETGRPLSEALSEASIALSAAAMAATSTSKFNIKNKPLRTLELPGSGDPSRDAKSDRSSIASAISVIFSPIVRSPSRSKESVSPHLELLRVETVEKEKKSRKLEASLSPTPPKPILPRSADEKSSRLAPAQNTNNDASNRISSDVLRAIQTFGNVFEEEDEHERLREERTPFWWMMREELDLEDTSDAALGLDRVKKAAVVKDRRITMYGGRILSGRDRENVATFARVRKASDASSRSRMSVRSSSTGRYGAAPQTGAGNNKRR